MDPFNNRHRTEQVISHCVCPFVIAHSQRTFTKGKTPRKVKPDICHVLKSPHGATKKNFYEFANISILKNMAVLSIGGGRHAIRQVYFRGDVWTLS